MNDTTENNGKNTETNKVCHTLRLGGSLNLVTLNSRVWETVGGGGEGGGLERRKTKKYFLWGSPTRYSLGRGCPIGHPFKLEMPDFKNFHMPS